MSFCLLKSSYKRDEFHDILINLDHIEAIFITERSFTDTENKVYCVTVGFNEGKMTGAYRTIQEAKQAIREMLKDKVSDSDIEDLSAFSK